MNQTPDTSAGNDIYRRQAVKFIAELTISQRHIRSYPPTHPLVAGAMEKTVASLIPLLQKEAVFAIGVSRNGLLFKNEILAPEMEKFREFADTLSSFGIIALTFRPGLTADDIHSFISIINLPRSEVWEGGGVRHAFDRAGIRAILPQVIDPSVFTLDDDTAGEYPSDPWETFVRKLLEGYFAVSPEIILQLLSASPEELAKEFGDILANAPEETHHLTIKTLADFLIALSDRQEEGNRAELLAKVASFVAGMPAGLRGEFIVNVANASAISGRSGDALLERIPGDAFSEAMGTVASHGQNIPEMLVGIMNRLAAQAETTPHLDEALTSPGSPEKVRVILEEAQVEKFVPQAYRKVLMSILSTDSLPPKAMESLQGLNETLDYDLVENKTGEIIYRVINELPPEERSDGFRLNLMSLASHQLMKGDFSALEKTCRIILEGGNTAESATLFDPGFIQEILDAAPLLEREKSQDIRSIICIVGQPFVAPLMERLFTEENRSRRRFWFDCLSELGEMVRGPALERLNDDRWFVVRNLIVMLSCFNDQEVTLRMRRLLNHPHPKVRREAMKNLLLNGDPAAERTLIQDLDGEDLERKHAAVQVAEMSGKPAVVEKLLEIVDSGGLRDYALELKKSALQSLAAIGDPRVLPRLNDILNSTRLFHSGKHNQLKIAIIRSLPRFPANQARPLLEAIASGGSKLLAPEAYEALKSLQGANP